MSQHFIDNFGLKSNDDVLDMGCGCGHVAVPFTRFLSARASYAGFDVSPSLISWCREHISRDHPNFHFWTADVYNAAFNPGGTLPPAQYRFHYKDASFDFAIAKSLFTHLLLAEAENYFAEAVRVLRPGGRFYLSIFLLTDESRALIAASKSALDLRQPVGPCMVVNPDRPELAVDIPESLVLEWFARYRMGVIRPALGSWCGRPGGTAYQDEFLLVKE